MLTALTSICRGCRYDIALRASTSYHPSVFGPPWDTRLNYTVYTSVASEVYGGTLGGALKEQLRTQVGPCAEDPAAFICHAYARHAAAKRTLITTVAATRRQALERALARQGMKFQAACSNTQLGKC